MSKSINEFILGPGTNSLLLKKPWSPTSGSYPTDTTEAYVYIAEDAGTVDAEDFVANDSIIYKDGAWIRFGSAAGGGGLESWTPTTVNPPVIVDHDLTANATIVDNGNGVTVNNTDGANPFGAADRYTMILDDTDTGMYWTINQEGFVANGNAEVYHYFIIADGNPFTGADDPTFQVGVNITNGGPDDWQIGSSTGTDPTTAGPFTDAQIVGQEIAVTYRFDGANVVTKVFLNGVLSLTLTELASEYGWDGTGPLYIGAAIITEAPASFNNVKTPVSPSVSVTQLTSGDELDPAGYPSNRTDKAFLISGLGITAKSVVGDVYDGVIITFGSDELPKTRTSSRDTFDATSNNTIASDWNFTGKLLQDGTEVVGTHSTFIRIVPEDDGDDPTSIGDVWGRKIMEHASEWDFPATGIITLTSPNSNKEFIVHKTFGGQQATDTTLYGYTYVAGNGNNWIVNGIDTSSDSYRLTRGERAIFTHNDSSGTWNITTNRAQLMSWITINSTPVTCVANFGYLNSNTSSSITYNLPSYQGLPQGVKIILINSGDASMDSPTFLITPHTGERLNGFIGNTTFNPSAINGYGPFEAHPKVELEYSGSTNVGWLVKIA